MSRLPRVVPPLLLSLTALLLVLTAPASGQPLREATTVDALARRADAVIAGSLTVLPVEEQRLLGSMQVEELIVGPESAVHAVFDLIRSPEDGPLESGGRFAVFLARDGTSWRPLAGRRSFIPYESPAELDAVAARVHRTRDVESPEARLAIWVGDLAAPVERLRTDAAFQLATHPAVQHANAEDVAVIGKALEIADDGSSRWLIAALGASRHPHALAHLVKLAAAPVGEAYRDELARAAAAYEREPLRQEVGARLTGASGDRQRAAQERLQCFAGRLGLVEHRPSLEALLLRSDEAICQGALEALAVIRDPASIEAIAMRLGDQRSAVRRTAAIALAAYRSEETDSRLREHHARETDPEVRWVVGRLLEAPAYYLAPLDPRR